MRYGDHTVTAALAALPCDAHGDGKMITKETNQGQSVIWIELEDGRFIKIQQEDESLEIIIPPRMKRWDLGCFMAIISYGIETIIYGIGVFRKTTLRFTNTHLHIERRFAFFRRQIPLSQVGEASCEMFDDLYLDWPEDIVTIPLGKNDCFNIHNIKTLEDQKSVASIINSFVTLWKYKP